MTYPNDEQQVRDLRARQLTIMADAVRSTREANRQTMTDEDRRRYDGARAEIDRLDLVLRSGNPATGDVARSRFDVPNINVKGSYSAGAEVTRSLDDFLWATADKVQAKNGAMNDVEQVVIRSDAGDTGRPAPRIDVFRPEHREAVRSFQGLVADMSMFGLLIDKQARTSAAGFEVARSHRAFKDQWRDVLRAMDVDTSGEGIDWVPTGIGATLHERVRAAGRIAPLFNRINIPTNPWKWPIEGGDATAYRVAEPTSDTATKMSASTPGTAAATFDAEIFGVRALTSKFLEADSAVAILPYLRDKFVKAMVDAEEKAILDGDTDGTHMDADVQALGVTDARSAWDGLRKKALAQTAQALTTTSSANLATVRKNMGKWGVDPSELAWIIGVSSYHVLLTDSNLITVDKFGPAATILSGQIGNLFGIPVIVSEHVREDLNASGVHDAITSTKTYGLCVRRSEWALGQRMALDIEADDSIYRETGQRVVVGLQRLDFQHIGSAATNDDTSAAFNITSGS